MAFLLFLRDLASAYFKTGFLYMIFMPHVAIMLFLEPYTNIIINNRENEISNISAFIQ